MAGKTSFKMRRISDHLWEIPRQGGMRVPARAYMPAAAEHEIRQDRALEQLVGVAHLPGIVGYALAMPDIHWGYGFPIGGVAAVDARHGAVSPGGVGYDINCGVRLVATELDADEVSGSVAEMVKQIYRHVPVGVGASKAIPRLTIANLKKVLRRGAAWAVDAGWTVGEGDLDRCEEGGCLAGADASAVSDRALMRGRDQLGTLGSGNHFLELDRVDEVFDPARAEAFGLRPGQLVLMIHSGSRGLGHQVCDDALGRLARSMAHYGEDYAAIPDRQLACAPISSPAGEQYLGGMQAAANFAWANRQVMASVAVAAIEQALGMREGELDAHTIYDVCHNIAKVETHQVDGERRRVLVHRKGATRAFGPDDDRVPEAYRAHGQPVIVPGDMGRYSYVLAGTTGAMRDTFGSACHGAGRVLSRSKAMKKAQGRRIDEELRAKGIEVMSKSRKTLAQEMPEAYKDVADVVDVLATEGIVDLVARLRPVGVVKG